MSADIAVILAYLVLINVIGLKYSGAKSMSDYFLGSRSIGWGLACFSIVATETSSLTFISIPGLAYAKGMGFLQISFGYLLGRVLVAFLLLPKYFEGNLETVYQYLQNRFGISSRRSISVVFHVTRVMSDSVRLFATAIPLTFMMNWDYRISILVIAGATLVYTYVGGLKSVVVTDLIQLFLYILSAFLGIGIIAHLMGISPGALFALVPGESLRIITTGAGEPGGVFGSYNIFSGIIGGAFLSFASHGTDHLIVQRVLSCGNLKAARKAMIWSGVIIIFQFALFLFWGLLIKVYLGGRAFASTDEIIPVFIINHLPAGVRGVMLAGIFAAAMSTLSSSINSLSASTTLDLLRLNEKDITEKRKVRISRMISLFWAVIMTCIALLLSDNKNPVIELGLSIASITYGGVLGMFLLGRFFRGFSDRAALAGVITAIAVLFYVAFGTKIFWPWYVAIGFLVCLVSGLLLHFALAAAKGRVGRPGGRP